MPAAHLPDDAEARAFALAAGAAAGAVPVSPAPFRVVPRAGALELRADRPGPPRPGSGAGSRTVVQAAGAALLGARVRLAAAGWGVEVRRLPSPDDPGLLAVLRAAPAGPETGLARLFPVLPAALPAGPGRALAELPQDLLARLARGALAEETTLVPVVRPDLLDLLGGVLRTASGSRGPLALLVTARDDPLAWLRAGEAVQRVLLEATAHGWTAAPLPEAVEVPVLRLQVREALAWHAHPQVLLRLDRPAPG